ncbi:MAG: hypothetical protein P4L50_11230 [Anaerolineaceae bacterium]|nr:hypothetical protein [Anaerolineaceae bacterium]
MTGQLAQPTSIRPVLRVTFDSNAWEKIFAPNDELYTPVRAALADGRIQGFICEAGFRIEAITKRQRPDYFAQPFMGVNTEIRAMGGGKFELMTSIGPDDSKHPGIPESQAPKFRLALAAGVKVMASLAWIGLPRPPELADRTVFVPEAEAEARERQDRQIHAAFQIEGRGVGKGAFEAVNGWELVPRTPAEKKQLAKACAEWADGELVAAHIGYQNEVLCTDDHARTAGVSVFNADNRAWLTADFGVVFKTLNELMLMANS